MNRRSFLRAAPLAVPIAAGWAGCVHRDETMQGSALQLSTSSIHFRDLSLEEACRRIAGLGFEAVDVWSAYEGCPHLDELLSRPPPGGVPGMLARTGLRLAAFSTYVGGYSRYASLLGTAGGGVAIQGSAAPCPPSELAARMKDFFLALRPLAELAERHRSCLAIENHGQALLDGLDSFRAFVDLNPYPQVGLALAPYHLQALGASVPEAIRIAGPQLRFFYAWQHAPGVGQLPGHGPEDFTPWLAALREIRFVGPVNVFMHGHLDPDPMSRALARAADTVRRAWHLA